MDSPTAPGAGPRRQPPVPLGNTYGGANWYRLTPDTTGDYRNGTWSSAFPMNGQRKYFASGVLQDGRVFVVGGEYSDVLGDKDKSTDNDARGEDFDPVTNTWTAMNKPTPGFDWIVGDCISMVLDDGRVLFGALRSARNAIWDPVTDTWTESGTKFGTVGNTKVGTTSEESWCLLPNGNVLTVQIQGTTVDAERGDVRARERPMGAAPRVSRVDAPGRDDRDDHPQRDRRCRHAHGRSCLLRRRQRPHRDVHVRRHGHRNGHLGEGPRPPRRCDQHQRAGRLADVPRRLRRGAAERSRAAHLRTGRPGGSFFSGPVTICDIDPAANTLTTPTTQPTSPPGHTWQCAFLILPNGHVLMTGEQNTINQYVPDAAKLTPTAACAARRSRPRHRR